MSEEEQIRVAMEESLSYNNKKVEEGTSKQENPASEPEDDMVEDTTEEDSSMSGKYNFLVWVLLEHSCYLIINCLISLL